MNNHQALSRINGREAFVMPDTIDSFVANLMQFSRTDPEKASALEAANRDSLEQAYGFGPTDESKSKPFIYHDGAAIIAVHGALLNRFGGSWGFVTGYQAIRRQMVAALEDDDVRMIVFDVDSPGGETAGCMELAEEIRASREIKPSLAVVDSLSASAGYALASAATQMVATPSSKIGSIGVYIMHVDMSGALGQAGVEINYIEAPKGGMKTAGSSYRKLDKRTAEYLQAFVDASYDEFVALVSENRGLEDAAIRETEARVYRAEEALALGLIDAVKTPSEAVSSFVAELADDDPDTESEDEDMNAKTTPKPEATSEAPAAVATAPSQEQIDAAIKADRERMAAIKALPEAAKRPALADKLALDGMTVEQATGILSVAAEEAPAVAAAPAAPAAPTATAPSVDTQNHLETAMANSQQPEVGGGNGGNGGANDEQPSDAELAKTILADHSAATGRKYETA